MAGPVNDKDVKFTVYVVKAGLVALVIVILEILAALGLLVRYLITITIVLTVTCLITAQPIQTKIRAERPPQTRIKVVDDTKKSQQTTQPKQQLVQYRDRFGRTYYYYTTPISSGSSTAEDCYEGGGS